MDETNKKVAGMDIIVVEYIPKDTVVICTHEGVNVLNALVAYTMPEQDKIQAIKKLIEARNVVPFRLIQDNSILMD